MVYNKGEQNHMSEKNDLQPPLIYTIGFPNFYNHPRVDEHIPRIIVRLKIFVNYLELKITKLVAYQHYR
jgi:hypothetical protein